MNQISWVRGQDIMVGGSNYHEWGSIYQKRNKNPKVSKWGICSSLKTQGQSELNLLGMFFLRSEFHTQHKRHKGIKNEAVWVFFMISSETIRPFGINLGRNVHLVVP